MWRSDMKLDYDEMIALAETKKELSVKTELIGAQEVDIFTYHVQMTDTFDNELAKWFRGTVYDRQSKKFVCRPFPKFFNLNEHIESHVENVDWDSALYFPKMDGSLVMPVLFDDGDIHWKSKSTFHSAHALKANELFHRIPSMDKITLIGILMQGYTPLFEFISNDPEYRIVVEYPEEKLVYLGAVNIDTGMFLSGLSAIGDISREDVFGMEGIEGFVVYDGKKMVKLKTEWYLTRHRAVWGMTKKAIVKATLDESIDDVIGIVAGLGMEDKLVEIEEIRDETNEEILAVESYVNDIYSVIKRELGEEYTRKEFALKVKDLSPVEYHGFLFALEDGRDITQAVKDFVFKLMMLR